MRLKALTLENFKGIREPVRVEFAPLTLLFGPNNAGKSTIVQALMYAREVLERGNCDARKTELGGDAVDLGGFLNLVHGNDPERVIRMRFELDLSPGSGYRPRFHKYSSNSKPESFIRRDLEKIEVDTAALVRGRDVCWVEVCVGMAAGNRPAVLSYAVGEELDPYATIRLGNTASPGSQAGASSTSLVLDFTARPFGKLMTGWRESWEDSLRRAATGGLRARLEVGSSAVHQDESWVFDPEAIYPRAILHPVNWADSPAPPASLRVFDSWVWDLIDQVIISSHVPAVNGQPLVIGGDALPVWGSLLYPPDRVYYSLEKSVRENGKEFAVPHDVAGFFGLFEFLTEIVVSPGECLLNELRGSVFLSAQRSAPDREYHSNDVPGTLKWWNGLAAWDELISDYSGLVQRVNGWLAGSDALHSGHEIEVRRYVELPVTDPNVARLRKRDGGEPIDIPALQNTVAALPEFRRISIRNLQSGARLTPRDVGAGLAQVIPVIVAALRTGGGLTALEEPESKMHPAFQMVLADLLIYAATRGLDEAEIERVAAIDPSRAEELSANWPRSWFLVETHSEHLMLRCLRRIRETSEGNLNANVPPVTPADIAVHFTEPSDGGPIIHRIRIDSDGEFMDPWPRGFFPERAKEIYGDDL